MTHLIRLLTPVMVFTAIISPQTRHISLRCGLKPELVYSVRGHSSSSSRGGLGIFSYQIHTKWWIIH
ncbi:hypothetical protein GIB67_000043 [Kingdonia uniflora]|uniref:Uncharacterized protein n=1 Tax=Kingdonia uniflora TaxID=39325 RepID=A0A7J7KYN7_9MAGN|nr:hypothetical protein GIB67_000043 [Kingdonia uniflora]